MKNALFKIHSRDFLIFVLARVHLEKRLDWKNFRRFLCHNLGNKLSNISRSKAYKTMKFGQLVKYNMRNIFLEKSYTKYGGETIPRPFSKKSKLSSGLMVESFLQFVFIVCQVEDYRNILKVS